MHCEQCGRFIGEGCVEGVDYGRGIQENGDIAWNGKFYCAVGTGCNKVDDSIKLDIIPVTRHLVSVRDNVQSA